MLRFKVEILVSFGGRFQEAADMLQAAIRKSPDLMTYDPTASYYVAALERLGRIDEAVAALRVSLGDAASLEKRANVEMRIADVYFNAKENREGAEAYRDVLKLNGTSADYRAEATYQLALCYQKSGLTNSAKAYMLRVSEKYPDTGMAKKARGTLYVWEMYGDSYGAK
jgi:tetratricopeptide (TPR) repeat protein